ncbi:hypothetical protein FGB62_127g111 [Gracilaria domingensis]|nr:hypothetical protein FGB62_127g111 [Gracilaria domingensis]
MYNSRCELIDTCLLRLVQIIISDKALINELDIPDAVIRHLTTATPRNAVDTILNELPNILLFESDDDDDHLLHVTVQKLRQSSRKEAFHKSIDPDGKCRVLRELVDYATMTDKLRHCVSTNLEHAEEERKKAREENSALRRKYEGQLRELRTELLEYKLKHGMIEPPSGSTGSTNDRKSSADPNAEQKNSATGTTSEIETDVVMNHDSSNSRSINKLSHSKNDSASGSTSREGHTTRKEKLLQAQRERKEATERRAKERGAQAIVARMDKLRANLKSLKNIRLRRRKGGSDSFPITETNSEQLLHTHGPQYSVRTYPLGTDREGRCYWFFLGSGRIWVEDTNDADWFSLTTMKSVQSLLRWLSPHRIEERLLKRRLRQRLRLIEDEMMKEQKSFELAEEATKERDITPRTTRAGKRRANQEAKTKKNKPVTTFLDYQNLES